MADSASHKIASRYAQALFELSGANGEAVLADMNALKVALAASTDLVTFVSSPLLSVQEKDSGMQAVAQKMQLGELAKKFLTMLAERKRLNLLPQIIEAYETLVLEQSGELAATLEVAGEVSDSVIKSATASLEKIVKRKLRVTPVRNDALLGGLKLHAGGMMLDASLSGKLARMAQELKATPAFRKSTVNPDVM